MKYIFLIILIPLFYFLINDYNSRMDNYNSWYCQEIYGLNPDCEVIK